MDECGSGLDICVLGPTQMFAHGQAVDVPGRQQQALLVMFVLYRGRVLSSQRLLEALWGPAPTASAATSLRVSVSKLRRALSAASAQDALVTSPGGYSLEVAPLSTDVGRFEAAVDAARVTASPRERLASSTTHSPCGGAALAPCPEHDPGVTKELGRLAELRELALEERADAALQLGRHRELVPALEALVADEPLRERRTELLMRALARSGRQVDALEAYRRLRCRLVDDLGLEPSAELRNLQAAILSPPVGAPPEIASPAVPVAPPLRPRRGSVRRWAAVVGGAVVLAAAGSVLLAAMRDVPAHPTSDLASTVARLDPDTGDLIGQLTVSDSTRVGTGYGGVVIDREIAWVRNDIDQTVSRVDLATGEVTDTVPVGAGTGDLTIADGDVWAANSAGNSVTRIDGGSGQVLATIKVGLAPQGIATAAGDVWVANHRGRPSGSVWRIDAETNEVVARIPVGAREFRSGPSWMAATADALWVGVPNLEVGGPHRPGLVLRRRQHPDPRTEACAVGCPPTPPPSGWRRDSAAMACSPGSTPGPIAWSLGSVHPVGTRPSRR